MRKDLAEVVDRLPVDSAQGLQPERCNDGAGDTAQQEQLMLDIFMLALGLGFFVLTIGYAYACERL